MNQYPYDGTGIGTGTDVEDINTATTTAPSFRGFGEMQWAGTGFGNGEEEQLRGNAVINFDPQNPLHAITGIARVVTPEEAKHYRNASVDNSDLQSIHLVRDHILSAVGTAKGVEKTQQYTLQNSLRDRYSVDGNQDRANFVDIESESINEVKAKFRGLSHIFQFLFSNYDI